MLCAFCREAMSVPQLMAAHKHRSLKMGEAKGKLAVCTVSRHEKRQQAAKLQQEAAKLQQEADELDKEAAKLSEDAAQATAAFNKVDAERE
jgi:cell division protein FtsB